MKKLDYREDMQRWLAEHRDEFIEDLKSFVRIKSVSVYREGASPPFGDGCKEMLDFALDYSQKAGFAVKNYDDFCGAAFWPGETDRYIGLFAHLDVVPEGDGWTECQPYDPVYKDGYLYGRGSKDNKSAAMVGLYLLRYMKERNIRLRHGVMVFFGCNEEAGMEDVLHFNKVEKPCDFCFVLDGRYPLTYGEKGGLDLDITCDLTGSVLRDFHGGLVTNSIPGVAHAVLEPADMADALAKLEGRDCTVAAEGNTLTVTTEGKAAHSAHPDLGENAIEKLAKVLAESGVLDEGTHRKIEMLAKGLPDWEGGFFGADFKDEQSGFTTLVGTVARVADDTLTLSLNCRYVVTAKAEDIAANVEKTVKPYGYATRTTHISEPCYVDRNSPVIQTLTKVSNGILGAEMEPYVAKGGTYARKLKNAVAFGPGRWDVERKGQSHQPDECVHIDDMLLSTEINLACLQAIDDMV